MTVLGFAFYIIHLHLLQARVVGSVAAGIMIACLFVQELYRPKRIRIPLTIWLVLAIATVIFVTTLLQVQKTIR